jgi:hypothetical protein
MVVRGKLGYNNLKKKPVRFCIFSFFLFPIFIWFNFYTVKIVMVTCIHCMLQNLYGSKFIWVKVYSVQNLYDKQIYTVPNLEGNFYVAQRLYSRVGWFLTFFYISNKSTHGICYIPSKSTENSKNKFVLTQWLLHHWSWLFGSCTI